jgi:hypothetical protein
MRSRRLFASLFIAALAACDPSGDTASVAPEPAGAVAAPAPSLDAGDVQEWIEFLAADEQGGRPPGTDADQRIREFIAAKMESFGLQPAGSDGFFQPFEITDGVKLREGKKTVFKAKKAAIAHSVLKFSHDTSEDGAVSAKLMFVGHGIAGEGDDSGNYKGLSKKVKGSIVVVLAGGPDDPHVPPSALRPQTKLIAARDRGAVGFVLWDPQTDVAYPNHGQVSDLKLPAVFVGAGGSDALLAALGAKGKTADKLKPGQRGRQSVELQTPVEPVVLQTANVMGRLVGSGASDEQIIIGAHHDHLGNGTSSSLAPGERAVHNGADDNASGVAITLALAEALAAVPGAQRPRDIVFATFGAEEMGLLGSKHLVEGMSKEDRERTVAMLNFDMVGRLRDKLIVNGTGTAKEWEEILGAANSKIELSLVPDGYGPSDHAAFYEAGVPVLHFFTGAHEDYHKPSDDIDKINYAGATDVGELVLSIVDQLQDRPERIAYVKVDRPKAKRGGFKVSLGTMPDYAGGVDGLKLAGVRGGGAAEKAGLKKDDVIVNIGDREIHGVDDFMASFGEMEPGKEITFVVERDGERKEITVVPAAPRRH